MKREQLVGIIDGPLLPRTKGVMFSDSVDKIVYRLSALQPGILHYKGRFYSGVSEVRIGPSVFRSFGCSPGCTACCLPFTLDFIPSEYDSISDALRARVQFVQRSVEINGVRKTVFTFDQSKLEQCPYLFAPRPDGGMGCGLWPMSPIECAAAPQLSFTKRKNHTTTVSKRPFGRAWNFVQKPQCKFGDDNQVALHLMKDVALLRRYKAWASYFEIDTCIDLLIGAISSYIASVKLYPKVGEVVVNWSK